MTLDKRKLKFAKDQLGRFESRLNNYGIGGLKSKTCADFVTPEMEARAGPNKEINIVGCQLNKLDDDLSN